MRQSHLASGGREPPVDINRGLTPPARLLIPLLLLASFVGCAPTPNPASDYQYPVPDFQLTERSGRAVSRDDLKGKVWIASFVYTSCCTECPQMMGVLARLQHELADQKDVTSRQLQRRSETRFAGSPPTVRRPLRRRCRTLALPDRRPGQNLSAGPERLQLSRGATDRSRTASREPRFCTARGSPWWTAKGESVALTTRWTRVNEPN